MAHCCLRSHSRRQDGRMSIREWPSGERPREKLLHRGSATLSDAELLAVLLGNGMPGKDAIALGRELLQEAGGLGALLGRADGPAPKPGLGPAKRARIAAALELARRSLAEQLRAMPSLGSPRDSGEFLSARLRHLPYEVFGCLYLDNRHRVLAFEELFRGTRSEERRVGKECRCRGSRYRCTEKTR